MALAASLLHHHSCDTCQGWDGKRYKKGAGRTFFDRLWGRHGGYSKIIPTFAVNRKNIDSIMRLSSSSMASLNEALHKIADLYSGEEDQLISTDFYFMPSSGEGRLHVFNDNDEEIATAEVVEWKDYDAEGFYAAVEEDLLEAIRECNVDGDLERLAVWMPYSFVLVDEERETVAELLLVDEDALLVTDGLLKGLDAELNEFINNLLNE